MGCAITAVGRTSDGNEFKSGSVVAQNGCAPKVIHGPPVLYPSKLPERRLRPAKSHTLQRKKRKAITDKIIRSCSVETKFPTGKGYTTSLTLIGPPKWHRKPEIIPASVALEPYLVPRPQDQIRLEILLVKEAEQRASDGIHPRIDRQLLSSGRTFARYETHRHVLVEFILTVPPPPSLHPGRHDLRDQLSASPDTRFAAAYLMTRFWFLYEVGSYTLEWKGFVDYGWQLAIACIALCVRMQRDFLPPLRPVTNKELVQLAPRGMGMTVYDLEQAQKDVLEAVSYSLQGNTPQPFLEELRCSLSMFQQLAVKISAEDLTRRFWVRMFDALLQRDVLSAPISMLAAAALVAISPAERAASLQEEVCSKLKITKVNFRLRLLVFPPPSILS
ncbi:hypothetical protein BJ322DRAFT_1080688 [Thelephora terrestris]|uniref:Uncharacterized protein n=1 Tax=Thelephora terrestris TaxID=56493 RepID=A0A9P6L452_9AGAM|nr:hypothetical protein BJ322DRAFT_1080688 [Thelephora terrestris]